MAFTRPAGILNRAARNAEVRRRRLWGIHTVSATAPDYSTTASDHELEIVKFKDTTLIISCRDQITAKDLASRLKKMTALIGSKIVQIGAVINVTEPHNYELWLHLKATPQLSQRTIDGLVALIANAESCCPTAAPAAAP